MKKSSLGLMRLLFVVFSLVATFSKAQDFQATIAKAKEASELGNHIDAERHWLRAIYFSTRENRFEPAFGLGSAYLGQNRLQEAASQYDFAAHLAPNDSLRTICFLNESKALLLNKDYAHLHNRLDYLGLQKDPKLEQRRQFYLGNANFGIGNVAEAEANFQACSDNAFTKAQIHDAFSEQRGLFGKHTGSAVAASLLIPGSGQLIAGKPAKALNAVLLIGTIAAGGVYTATAIGFLPAAIVLGPTFLRYYVGSAVRAGWLYKKKLSKKKQALLEEVYQILERS